MLQGNLEDLPLLDIIQIVSFSKKTGYLSIQMEGGDGAIVFHEGLLVAAFTARLPPPDPKLAQATPPERDAAVRRRVAYAMEQLARLREGAFGFELTERVPDRVGTRDIHLDTLTAGINPQEMLLELAQGIDEDRASSAAAVEASFETPEETVVQNAPMAAVVTFDAPPPPASGDTAPTPKVRKPSDTLPPGEREPVRPPAAAPSAAAPVVAPPAGPPPLARAAEPLPPRDAVPDVRILLLVDDEADVRQILRGRFEAAGFQVEEAEDPAAAAKAAGRLREADRPFVLVTDLGMPATGGASFHGGFEVLKRLWKMNLRPPAVMMTESLNHSLRLRAKQMGVQAFVFKPTLSRLNPVQFEADLSAFASNLSEKLLPRMCEIAALRAPVREKAVPPPKPGVAGPPPEKSGGEVLRPLEFLRRRLLELRQGGDANEIAVLVMKVAREYFERAILFVVKNHEARGLGAFGLAPRDETLNLVARQITLPLGEPSVFQDVFEGRKPFAGPLPHDRWTGHLLGRIGRFQSRGAAILPLVAHRETIAMLFGDNPESGRDTDRLAALEVFVEQAGIALENVFLQRKLQSIEERDRAGVG